MKSPSHSHYSFNSILIGHLPLLTRTIQQDQLFNSVYSSEGRQYRLRTRAQLLKGWIALSSEYISIQGIVQSVSLILVHWIVIYPMDSAIQCFEQLGPGF